MERIIAKIDNDFNPDNSDWIPRVAAWTIDAMSILKVMQEETVTKTYEVKDRIAYNKCGFGDNIIKVLDENGCIIKEMDSSGNRCGCSFTGERIRTDLTELSGTMAQDNSIGKGLDPTITVQTNYSNKPNSHVVTTIKTKQNNCNRNYVLVGKYKIELNYDTKTITVITKSIKTEYSDTYGCEIPTIPNNGILIECIVAWCMYKMLCRGYKHPVFNLSSNQPHLNPFIFWNQNKDKAKDSVNIDAQGDIDSKLWRSAFYVDTFDPRR